MADTPEIPVDDFDAQMMATYAEPAPTPSELAPAPVPAPAVPVAQEPAPAPAEPAPAPSPVMPDPNGIRPDIAKNFRITANDAIEQRTLQLRAQDRSLTLADALAKAHEEMGLPAPVIGRMPSPEPAPAPTPAPTETLADRIAALEAEQELLNPALDAAEYHRLNKEIRTLQHEQAQQAVQQQIEALNSQQVIEANERALRSEYDALTDPAHPFTLAFEAEKQRVYQNASDDELGDPQLELKIAQSVAHVFQTRYGMTVGKTPSRPAATLPQALNVTQQPAPAAAPAPIPAASPRSAVVPPSGASASANPVMGVRQADPSDNVAAILSSGKPVGEDFDAALMSAAYTGGTAPAAPGRYSIAA